MRPRIQYVSRLAYTNPSYVAPAYNTPTYDPPGYTEWQEAEPRSTRRLALPALSSLSYTNALYDANRPKKLRSPLPAIKFGSSGLGTDFAANENFNNDNGLVTYTTDDETKRVDNGLVKYSTGDDDQDIGK